MAEKISIDLDEKTAMLVGTLAKKGLVKVQHDAKQGFGKAKLEMSSDPKDKKVILKANLHHGTAMGFPVAE